MNWSNGWFEGFTHKDSHLVSSLSDVTCRKNHWNISTNAQTDKKKLSISDFTKLMLNGHQRWFCPQTAVGMASTEPGQQGLTAEMNQLNSGPLPKDVIYSTFIAYFMIAVRFSSNNFSISNSIPLLVTHLWFQSSPMCIMNLQYYIGLCCNAFSVYPI